MPTCDSGHLAVSSVCEGASALEKSLRASFLSLAANHHMEAEEGPSRCLRRLVWRKGFTVLIPFPLTLAGARGFSSAAGSQCCSQVGGQGAAFPSPSH